jgi:competence protein ComEC
LQRPIVVFIYLWITGYVLALYVNVPWLSWPSSLLLAGAAAAWFLLRMPARLPVCALLLVGVSFGYFHWTDQRNVSALLPLAQKQADLSGSDAVLRGRLAGPVSIDGDRAAFTLEAESVRFQEGDAFPMRGERVQVSLRLLQQEQQAQAAGWRRGDAIKLHGTLQSPEPARNFGGFDYRRYLRLQSIHWLITAKGTEQAQVEPAGLRFGVVQLLRWNDELRRALDGRMNRIFPDRHAGMMKAMLIGQQDDLDPERFQQFSELGLTHILAISGLNVAVFLAVFIGVMRKLRVTKETYLLYAMLLMPCYILITGSSPSIVRAGLMAMIALYAARRGLLKDALHITAIVAWLMLLWNPYYLLDVSFQLSFLVTVGLIIGVQRVSHLLPFSSRVVRNTLSITLVSQLISFPISIYYFNQFSLLSWAANAVLVPLISLVVFPAGLAALVLGLLYVPAGQAIGFLLAFLNDGIFAVTDFLQHLRFFQTIWPSPGIAWMSAYYCLLTVLYLILEKRNQTGAVHLHSDLSTDLCRREASQTASAVVCDPLQASWSARPSRQHLVLRIYLYAALAGFVLLLFVGYTPNRFTPSGLVQFLDVGQGDSILIRTPEGRHILIDGGGTLHFRKSGEEWKNRRDPYDVGHKLLVPLLKKRGVHHLDLLIMTHEDADHSGGLQAVLEQIPVKQFLFNGTYKPNQGVEKLFKTALDRRIPLLAAEQSHDITIDPKTQIELLFPAATHKDSVRIAAKQNDQSLVFILHMEGTKWLFTGDMEKDTEAALLEARQKGTENFPVDSNVYVDVMKVAHHGSKTSSSEAWLDYWKPHFAVISVGQTNSYGHPSAEVVERLEQQHAGLFRTDLMGEVQIENLKGILYERTKLPR